MTSYLKLAGKKIFLRHRTRSSCFSEVISLFNKTKNLNVKPFIFTLHIASDILSLFLKKNKGIFFTSRVFDFFKITSHKLYFHGVGNMEGVFWEEKDDLGGYFRFCWCKANRAGFR